MSQPFIGEIIIFAGNFAPRAWAFCEGQLQQISANTALFSILGTTYGGDGRTTFGLPNLTGRTAVHAGRGPGLTDRRLGQKSGAATNTLQLANLASHNHTASTTVAVNTGAGDQVSPVNHYLSQTAGAGDRNYSTSAPDALGGTASVSATLADTGSSTPVTNEQPLLSIYYIICLQGVYPSRS